MKTTLLCLISLLFLSTAYANTGTSNTSDEQTNIDINAMQNRDKNMRNAVDLENRNDPINNNMTDMSNRDIEARARATMNNDRNNNSGN